ncbi:MutS-related protein [Candidatus Cardinium hertigii]|jgi:DNA mismatch repair protein MutS|uniref:DNA mismatch repair proteins mutS family domain-containing protein n=1 Tax=Candidatus Cardinium hertigii TaxID=247481 RepID=A0A3N2QC08_9BACT|nr:hypothetical protein [Candidatus Cardinium hertigii]ROT47340.1 hypothetical protein EDM02_02775 [Candidatus Cardinium hertigii]
MCSEKYFEKEQETCSITLPLAASYLKSFESESDESEKKQPSRLLQSARLPSGITNITAIYLTPREERAIVFNKIFATSQRYQACYPTSTSDRVLNQYAWKDLHLFCGTTTTPNYHFLSRINKTITVLGESALASLLAAPTADLSTLTKRQQLIALLGQDKVTSQTLKVSLREYKNSEKQLLSFWTETDPLYTKEYGAYLTRLFYYKDRAATNKKAGPLQMRKLLLRDIWNIHTNFVWYPLLCGAVMGPMYAFFIGKTWANTLAFYKEAWPFPLPLVGIWFLNKTFKDITFKRAPIEVALNKFIYNFAFVSINVHSFYQYYRGYKNYKEYSGVLRNLALRMADVQTFFTVAKKVNAVIQANPRFEALYGEQFAATRKLLERTQEQSEIGTLLRYLEELPFRAWSYVFGHAGKLLASYKLFVEHKAAFHDAMYELGQLDALLSIVTLMEETRAKDAAHAYTFTKFVAADQATKPHLALTAMWNPMLKPTVAVGNDIKMDVGDVQTIVLTGPNAGGKSTFLTGVIYTVLLSQTFGIAAAQACELTPFSSINTYIDITDDIAAGKSLFMAEVARFQDHLNRLKQLKRHAFSFSIFDEPFSGTNPTEGAAAEYSVLSSIASYQNTFNIVATHYPIVMLLEKNEPTKGFKNYQVFITKDAVGRIQYSYKVIPGESTQTIALDILEEEGYASEMLKQARDIIANPDKYKQSFTDPKQTKTNNSLNL